jgi:hypothetical protein
VASPTALGADWLEEAIQRLFLVRIDGIYRIYRMRTSTSFFWIPALLVLHLSTQVAEE